MRAHTTHGKAPGMADYTLSEKVQLLLDQLVNGTHRIRYNGETWIASAVAARGVDPARKVGREMRTLTRLGLVGDDRSPATINAAGFDRATIHEGNEREALRTAYRMANLPPEVMRRDMLLPEPVRDAGEEKRALPREGYQLFDLSDRLLPYERYPNPEPDGHDHDYHRVDIVVNVAQFPYQRRHHLLFFGPEAVVRRSHQGPMVRGVYASAYGLSTVIDNYGGSGAEMERDRANNRVIDITLGDVVAFGEYMFVIERANNYNITLTRLAVGDLPGGLA
ncbi:MAG: hypothetical protein ABWZ30_01050 [Jiangellaceae bacterium]